MTRCTPESWPIRSAAARDGVHVAVWVADQGRGIAPERLADLFRKHGGAGDPGSGSGAGGAGGETGGSGLGLAIYKGLVETHGGRIRAESPGPSQDARFTFTLPVAEEAAAIRLGPDDRPAPQPEAECVLVVDDDPHTEVARAGLLRVPDLSSRLQPNRPP